jgi:hypothetical protein
MLAVVVMKLIVMMVMQMQMQMQVNNKNEILDNRAGVVNTMTINFSFVRY